MPAASLHAMDTVIQDAIILLGVFPKREQSRCLGGATCLHNAGTEIADAGSLLDV